MLNMFYNESDEHKSEQFRTAYILEENGSRIPFRYYKLTRSDYSRAEWLRGIPMMETRFVIRTTKEYDFTVKTKILLDGKRYAVDSIYTEEREDANGMFTTRKSKFRYLTIAG